MHGDSVNAAVLEEPQPFLETVTPILGIIPQAAFHREGPVVATANAVQHFSEPREIPP